MKGKNKKIFLLFAIAILIVLFFVFDLKTYLSLDFFKSKQLEFEEYYAAHMMLSIAIYMGIYILVAALSLPGATAMTLIGGALFGLWTGLIMVSFASTIGATLAFLVSRFLLRDYVQNKFGDKLKAINDGIKKDGAFYLFTLRLIPAFPFFVINLVMGLTRLSAGTFYWVSQLGMIPATLVYVNAGTQIAQVESLAGILSPQLLGSFVLLGLFPLITRKLLGKYKDAPQRRRFPRSWTLI